MFTGIIEEIGNVEGVTRGANSSRIRIKANMVLEGTRIGDSICTSGVCLTVTKLEGGCFDVDVMAETMRRSKLGSLNNGSRVNLERAMQLDGRLGGHLVSGHIDGVGIINDMTREENAVWFTISTEEPLLRYIVEKGSIAIDGISLTVAAVDQSGFKVSVIPHTGQETTLLKQKAGDVVNLECDIIGKYVEKLINPAMDQGKKKESLTEGFLKQNGFF